MKVIKTMMPKYGYGTNTKKEFMDLSTDLLVSISGIGIFLAVLVTGFKMILQSKNLNTIIEAMSELNYIIIGT